MVEPDAEVVPFSCTWEAGDRLQVTYPPNDKGLHSMAVSRNRVLLGWKTTNPDPPADNTHYLQSVTFDGLTATEKVAIFPPPGLWNYGVMSIAAGPDHFGATVWDEASGCRFRRLDAGGAPRGESRYVDPTRCSWLRSTPTGFSVFTHAGWPYERRLVRMNPEGVLVGTSDIIEAISGGPYWWSSVRLPDGTYVVSGMQDEFEPHTILTQHIAANGAPLDDPVVITELDTPANRVHLVAAGDSVFAGWLAADSPDDEGQVRYLTLQQLGLDGRALGAPYQASNVIAYRDGGWSIVRHENQLLAAVVEPLDLTNTYGDPTALVMLPFTLDGEPDGPPLELTTLRFIRHPRIRSTPDGVLAGFQAMPDETPPHQIFTVSATCIPDRL